MDDYYVLNCSFGKDSMAMLKICVDKGYPIDEVCYIKMFYDKEHSAEYPEHYRFIQEVGIPYITDTLGLKYHEIIPKITYKELFYKKFQKGEYKGQNYGFAQRWCAKCNSDIKVNAFRMYISEMKRKGYRICQYVGIAADEKKRIRSGLKKGLIMPLYNEGITEREALKICKSNNILSPLYSEKCIKRIGCFFCPHCTIPQLRYLYMTSPDLIYDLAELDKYSPFKFHPPYTATELLRKFESEAREQTKLSEFCTA